VALGTAPRNQIGLVAGLFFVNARIIFSTIFNNPMNVLIAQVHGSLSMVTVTLTPLDELQLFQLHMF
jgi:hypothetical protein